MIYFVCAITVTVAVLFVGFLLSLNRRIENMNADFRALKEQNSILHDNVEKNLAAVKQTVGDKLENTLQNRLDSSFSQVSIQLQNVYRELGAMQNLAKEVDSLERVLTNVKARGTWGELQAKRILEDLIPGYYKENVVVRPGSMERVEYAVCLPDNILLPIDSKFPKEDYERITEAAVRGDKVQIEQLRDVLARSVAAEAKKIHDKYIVLPYTTDFAVMFLPVEGLFAEVLSIAGLQEKVQHDFHIMIAGPTTLASLLNSLSLGFKSLAIQKQSAKVWEVLGQFKTQFGKYNEAIADAEKKLNEAQKKIGELTSRQRAMARTLKDVEELPVSQEEEEGLLTQ